MVPGDGLPARFCEDPATQLGDDPGLLGATTRAGSRRPLRRFLSTVLTAASLWLVPDFVGAAGVPVARAATVGYRLGVDPKVSDDQ